METGYFFPLFYFFFGAFVFFLDSPAHIRATAEDRFQMRVKTPVATAFLCWHDSHASLTRSSQNLPSPPPSVTGSDAAQLKSRGSNHLPPRQRRRRLVLAGGARETEWWWLEEGGGARVCRTLWGCRVHPHGRITQVEEKITHRVERAEPNTRSRSSGW